MTASTISFTMTVAQAELIHNLAREQMAAQKNWIVSAVEEGDLARAQRIAAELRELSNVAAGFNMDAKRVIAAARGEAIPSSTTLKR